MSIFDLKTTQEDSTARIAFYGEFDLASARRVEEELERVERAGPERIVLDLRGLTFMDSTGLRLILSAHARAVNHGRKLAIVQGGEAIKRIFKITGVFSRLNFVDAPTAGAAH